MEPAYLNGGESTMKDNVILIIYHDHGIIKRCYTCHKIDKACIKNGSK